jgi:hypothetical protein
MKHLSNDELMAAAESGGAQTPHLETCESCSARVEELRRVVRLASEVDVPEPSPLFWNHFSDRVREAVAAEPIARATGWRFNVGWTTSVVGALAIIVIGVAVTLKTAQPMHPNVPTAAVDVAGAGNNLPSLNDDPTWALMGELASQIDFEDAGEAGLTTRPGSAEQALAQMSDEEQRQVVELLQLELQKTKRL